MSKLCITLPPFAPDYSGAASALFELGGMIIVHDASGCTGNYLGYDEPRWFDSPSAVFCSGLRSMDAILGTDDQFEEKVITAAQSLHPAFIAILGSPVPMIIGTDFEGIAREIEDLTGIPSFGFTTNGLHYYTTGIHTAVNAVVERFADRSVTKKTRESGINLLGMTPIDFSNTGNDRDFKNLFESAGVPVIANYCMGLTLDAVKKSSHASLNVVVSQSGIATALLMRREFGIPFIIQTPVGNSSVLVKEAREILTGGREPDEDGMFPFLNSLNQNYGECSGGILIAGEQVISFSIRNYLRTIGYKGRIDTAVLFDASVPLLENGDTVIKNEKQLRLLIRNGGYNILLSDPLVHHLAGNTGIKCVALPHPGISGRLSWKRCPRYADKKTEKTLHNIVEEI